MSVDSRGVTRGCCNVPGCSCFAYDGTSTSGGKCDSCHHPPGRHANSSMTTSFSLPVSLPPPSASDEEDKSDKQPVSIMRMILGRGKTQGGVRRSSSPGPVAVRPPPAPAPSWGASLPSMQPLVTCRHPNCGEAPFFDLNTSEDSVFCSQHMSQYPPHFMMDQSLPVQFDHTMTSVVHQPDKGFVVVPDGMNLHTTPLSPPTNNPAPPPPLAFQPFPQPLPPPPAPNLFQQHTVSAPPQFLQQQVPLLPDHERCTYPKCNKKRYKEPNGRVHPFCNRYHATEYAKLKGGADSVQPEMKCKTQGCSRAKRACEDGNGYYDYCGKSCRDGKFRTTPAAAGEMCSLPGCTKQRYVDPSNNRVHDYCGITHANQALSRGIAPRVCTIRLLSQSELGQVQSHFKSNWCPKKGTCPPVVCVFEVTNQQLEARWNIYRQKLPSSRQNVEKHYHGTMLKCDIVNSQSPCNDKECGVCGISTFGMFRECIRKNINFQRFGHGFYFAPNSSKCHDYTQGLQTHRAMLLVEILPGQKYTITNNDVKLTQPPDGCHSVYGKSGQALNYAELVVYNPDCVMPRYIIVYSLNGVHKIAN